MDYLKRISDLRAQLRRNKLSGIVIQSRINSFYFSGFPCSNSILLVTPSKAFFFTDSRYITKAVESIKHLEVVLIAQRALGKVAETVKKLRLRVLGFEDASVTYAGYQGLSGAMKGIADLAPASSLIASMRSIKSGSEIRIIAANQKINEQLFLELLEGTRRTDTELQLRQALLRRLIDLEAEEAFQAIIASGPNSALPHAIPGKTRIKQNAFLLFDMGVAKKSYHSDMTRTVWVGERVVGELRAIYDVVLQAQEAALRAVGPGVACSEIDGIARGIIAKAGYSEYFGHGLGHGVGLEIHEGPTLSPKSQDVLKPGMVITIEPGIYLPGKGGVRIEDLVVVTDSGYRNLTSLSKQFQTISMP